MIKQLEQQCWSLDIEFAKYILPRLLYFKNWTEIYGCPEDCEDLQDWNEILEELCWTFTYIASDYSSRASEYIDEVNIESNEIIIKYIDKEEYDKALEKDSRNKLRCKAGLKLFAEYYMCLWT